MKDAMNLKVDVQKKENALVDLNVEVALEDLHSGYTKELNKFRQSYKMPGFRPGKVPVELIEKQYKGYIESEAVQKIVSSAYYQALVDNKLQPYGEPKFNKFDFDFTKPLSFVATLEIAPAVDALGDYKSLAVEQDKVKVAPKDIDESIAKVRNDFAELLTKEGAVEKGDIIVLDAEAFKNDKPFKNGNLKDYKVEVDSKFLPTDFVKGLVGMKKNDAKDILVKYANDYFNSNLAGQKILFKVNLKDVMQKKLPELNDDFAKDVGAYENFDAFKNDVEKKLSEESNKRENALLDDKILEKILKTSKFSIPQSLINKQIETKFKELEQKLSQNGLTLEQYYAIEKTDKETVEKSFQINVHNEIKSQLVLMDIAEKEKIKVSDEDYNAEIEKYSQDMHMPVEQIKKYFAQNQNNYLKTELLLKKTLQFLRDSADKQKGKTIKFSEYK